MMSEHSIHLSTSLLALCCLVYTACIQVGDEEQIESWSAAVTTQGRYKDQDGIKPLIPGCTWEYSAASCGGTESYVDRDQCHDGVWLREAYVKTSLSGTPCGEFECCNEIDYEYVNCRTWCNDNHPTLKGGKCSEANRTPCDPTNPQDTRPATCECIPAGIDTDNGDDPLTPGCFVTQDATCSQVLSRSVDTCDAEAAYPSPAVVEYDGSATCGHLFAKHTHDCDEVCNSPLDEYGGRENTSTCETVDIDCAGETVSAGFCRCWHHGDTDGGDEPTIAGCIRDYEDNSCTTAYDEVATHYNDGCTTVDGEMHVLEFTGPAQCTPGRFNYYGGVYVDMHDCQAVCGTGATCEYVTYDDGRCEGPAGQCCGGDNGVCPPCQ